MPLPVTDAPVPRLARPHHVHNDDDERGDAVLRLRRPPHGHGHWIVSPLMASSSRPWINSRRARTRPSTFQIRTRPTRPCFIDVLIERPAHPLLLQRATKPSGPRLVGARVAGPVLPKGSRRLPAYQTILNAIGNLLADGCQVEQFFFAEDIFGFFGKLPVRRRLVPKVIIPIHACHCA